MSESNGKSEFFALTWVGVVALFAAGFMLAQGIESWRHNEQSGGEFFLAIMFALFSRADAKSIMVSGTYVRRLLMWSRS